jgi:hypothetical protein
MKQLLKIAILKLENTSYPILWFFPNFTILNLFRKIHFRVWNPNSKVYDFYFWNNEILIEINFVEVVKVLFDIRKFLF